MKNYNLFSFLATGATGLILLLQACGDTHVSMSEASLTPLSFEDVELQDSFWLPRLKTQKETLVPFSLDKTQPAVENLRRVGAYLKEGKKENLLPLPRYVASDLFKVMEGAAYLLKVEKDPVLEARMDSIIDIIADAQCDDGYLYEIFSVDPSMRKLGWGAGDKPYSYVIHSHELYNMGHMYEGAIAYYRATGKRKWLDVAEKNARHINKVFFVGDSAYNDGKPVNQAPGHEEIELALVKLYQVTGDTLYLNMADRFLNVRGVTFKPDGEGIMSGEYSQQHAPVRDQDKAVGHSVRAMYLYSGMADVMGAKGDTTLLPALESIWHDVVDKKMHINGGLGAIPGIEGFGPDYDLPNKNTYDETCAAVGNVLFNYRMFLATKDAKYLDVAEIALYNNVLAGVNIEGNKFFYVNVLEADGKKAFNHGRAGRSPWFGTACCPSNMARLIPQLSGMIYSYTPDEIFCGLYAGSSATLPLDCGDITLEQRTDYPFSGNIDIEVTPAVDNAEFTLWLRIPSWCGDRFVPGELYSYVNKDKQNVKASVNGSKIHSDIINGYFPVKRKWKTGDVISLDLPMEVRYSIADERVEADIDRVCVTRGPLVYCAEQPDNTYPAYDYVIDNTRAKAQIGTINQGILKGIDNIILPAQAVVNDSVVAAQLTLIPYYAWNNRGDDMTMNVWFARTPETVIASTPRPVGNITNIKATHTYSTDTELAIADGILPKSSSDGSIPRWTSWPHKGETQTVELTLKKNQPIESIMVYWFDDNQGVRLPKEWSVEYRNNGEWKDMQLYNTDMYGRLPDQFNMIHPSQTIEADAIRLIITPQPDYTVGILEATIE